jgi:threonine aldolase
MGCRLPCKNLVRAFLTARIHAPHRLRDRGWEFYTFIGGAARTMFAWDTDLKRVDALARDLRACAAL